MIAVRPGKRAYDVLRLIVESPGEHTTGTLVDALDPAPRRTVPFTKDDPPWVWAAMVAEHNRVACAKMARLVGKLVEMGLVEKLHPPALSPEYRRALETHGDEALYRFHPAFPERPKGGLSGHRRLVERVVEESPGSARDLLEDASDGAQPVGEESPGTPPGESPSGARQRVYRDLIRWGVLVAPQQRHATPAGVALIAPQPLSVVA